MTTAVARSEAPSPVEGAAANGRYIGYLPAIYRSDPFMCRFLRIFEDILTPLERMVDVLPLYFDPMLTPEGFLPWLATWLDVALNERMPPRRQRELVRRAAWLYRWRGTARALREHLRICLGVAPLITELTDGMDLRGDAQLGVNARLGRPHAGHIVVTIPATDDGGADIELAKRIVEAQKPAGTTYALQAVRARKGTNLVRG